MTHEHMDYLLDNGYTDDANRLADHQFATGLRMSEWYDGDGSHLPRATQAGLDAGRVPRRSRHAGKPAGVLAHTGG